MRFTNAATPVLLGFLFLRSLAAGSSVADISSTVRVIAHGGEERNPFLRPATVPMVIAADAGTLIGIYSLEESHPKLAKMLYWGVIGTRAFAAIHNFRQ